jgi:RAD51-like protein 2
MDLAQETGLPLQVAARILTACANASGQENVEVFVSASELTSRNKTEKPIITFCRSIDRMLGGNPPMNYHWQLIGYLLLLYAGGIAVGQITELCGVPGIGKTQIAMQLACDVHIPGNEFLYFVVYIMAHARYSIHRDIWR